MNNTLVCRSLADLYYKVWTLMLAKIDNDGIKGWGEVLFVAYSMRQLDHLKKVFVLPEF
jgi:L-alanine-DL-glutamate epimerase-like enolase superfamily enzyme